MPPKTIRLYNARFPLRLPLATAPCIGCESGRGKMNPRELTVYISKDEEEYVRVLSELDDRGVQYRVWTTAEYPVMGWTALDPRLMGRGEKRLRRVYHIDVDETDRRNLITANMAVRAVTGRMFNAERVNEII